MRVPLPLHTRPSIWRSIKIMKKTTGTLLLVCLMFPLLGSSSFHQPFPPEWKPPDLPSNTACLNIYGKYLNGGESKNPQYKPTLEWYLFRQSTPWKETTHVSFNGDDGFGFSRIVRKGTKDYLTKDGNFLLNISFQYGRKRVESPI